MNIIVLNIHDERLGLVSLLEKKASGTWTKERKGCHIDGLFSKYFSYCKLDPGIV